MPPPVDVPPLIEVIQWHRYRDNDPARIWLHGMLKAALEPTVTWRFQTPAAMAIE
jgi:hypothetical protein